MRQGSTAIKQHAGSGLVKTLAFAFALASVCATAPAHAEAEFPSKIQDLAGMPCTPTCLMCHTDPAGGVDHLRKAADGSDWALISFTFLKAGGTAANLAPLEAKDSDGDGTSDLKEIQTNQDPLVKGDVPVCSELRYGCAAHIARQSPLDRGEAAWLVAAAAGCVFAARRRAKPRTR